VFISCWVCGLTEDGNGVDGNDRLEEGVELRDVFGDEESKEVDG
jgi:predicted RNA-binding protein